MKNMTGQHIRLPLTLLCLILFLALAKVTVAQDVTITNLAQLANVALSANYSLYLPWTPWQWRAYSTDNGEPWWVDCSQLDCENLLSTSTNSCATLQMHGVTVTSIVLTKNILTGEALVQSGCSTDVIASIAAPSGYEPGALLGENAWVWREWQQITNCLDCWGLSADEIPPPIVTLKTRLADASTYSVYQSNVEADAEAAAAAWASAFSSFTTGRRFTAMDGGGMMLMDDDEESCSTNEDTLFGILSITQDTNGTTITWGPTCDNFIYGVFSVDSLDSTNPAWIGRMGAWGNADGSAMTWTDTTTAGVTQRFFKVLRILPTATSDWDHDGMPDIWEANHGLNPFDPSDADMDPDGDGYSNYAEFVNGTDPQQADPMFDVIVNGGDAYTPSLTISLLASSTNYPQIYISTDVSMTNAVVWQNTGVSTNYTLVNAEGLQNLYFQYADASGQAHSAPIYKTVIVDRVPPTVQITSPASNAVLDQAFITLQGIAFDPDPVLTTDSRPLKIWINDNPYWDRSGTNITIKRFPVPSGTNSFTVTIQAMDAAGNTNTATQTWTVDSSGDTTPPHLSGFNITTNTLLPDVEQIWVEGAVDDSNALVNAIVNASDGVISTNSLNVRDLQFEGLVPLEFGTNQLLLLAFDAAGNTTSNAFMIVRSNRYRFAITSPAFDQYSSAFSNYVSGYVSALFDEGLPTQTNVTSVLINGVAAVLGTNVDTNGNLSFTTTNAIPLGVPIIGFLAGPGIPTDPPPDPDHKHRNMKCCIGKSTLMRRPRFPRAITRTRPRIQYFYSVRMCVRATG